MQFWQKKSELWEKKSQFNNLIFFYSVVETGLKLEKVYNYKNAKKKSKFYNCI